MADITATIEQPADINVTVEGGIQNFLALSDVDPTTYSGQSGKTVTVNAGEDALEFTSSGSGDVVGPGVAVNENITVFDSTTGKLIKDSGTNISAVTSNTTHRGLTNDPHSVTATQVGLGNVSDVATDDTAYNATSWDANSDSATKNAIRDKVETMDTAIGLNTSKVTNVSTDLSEGTSTETTVDVNSSDGTNATLVSASAIRAGLLTKAKFDEIVSNTTDRHASGSDDQSSGDFTHDDLISGTIADHDTTATGTELNTLTGGGDTTLHDHDGISENTTHRSSDGSDHSIVGTNTTAIGLNTTHRGSAGGTDHSDVNTNNSKVSNANHSGDATGSTALTLATVNSNVGSFTSADITVNAKGLVTAASSGSGGGGITWNEVTGTSQSASVDNGYITNNAGLVTVTLPDTAPLGSTLRIAGLGAGGWKLAQNASELIYFGNSTTTTGTGGSLASTLSKDSIELVCVVANTEWSVISSVGNITIT